MLKLARFYLFTSCIDNQWGTFSIIFLSKPAKFTPNTPPKFISFNIFAHDTLRRGSSHERKHQNQRVVQIVQLSKKDTETCTHAHTPGEVALECRRIVICRRSKNSCICTLEYWESGMFHSNHCLY